MLQIVESQAYMRVLSVLPQCSRGALSAVSLIERWGYLLHRAFDGGMCYTRLLSYMREGTCNTQDITESALAASTIGRVANSTPINKSAA